MSKLYGYARVSTAEQDLSIQTEALQKAGCETIREEKRSGTTRQGRDELDTLLAFLRAGDTLVVTRIDRLARSIGDLQDIVRSLKAKGVSIKATEQPIDTSTAAGKAFLDMLGVFAEFETNLRRERQLEGIASAKARGVYKGRKRSIERNKILELDALGLGATEIATKTGIGRSSVYRILNAQRDNTRVRKNIMPDADDPFAAMGLKFDEPTEVPTKRSGLPSQSAARIRERLDSAQKAYDQHVAQKTVFGDDYDPSTDPVGQAYLSAIEEQRSKLNELNAHSSLQADGTEHAPKVTSPKTSAITNKQQTRELSDDELRHMRMELDDEARE